MQNLIIILAGLSIGLSSFALIQAARDLRAFILERARIKRRLAEIAEQGGNVRWRIIKRGEG